jgi:hypothetical protein
MQSAPSKLKTKLVYRGIAGHRVVLEGDVQVARLIVPAREPEFCPNTWFCEVEGRPVTSEGETPTRMNEWLLAFQFWSSFADHRLVFLWTG